MNKPRRLVFPFAAIFALCLIVAPIFARLHSHSQEDEQKQNRPWMNTSLSPDERAELVLKEMTLDEKIDLVHGNGMPGWGKPRPNAYLGNGGAGFCRGAAGRCLPVIPKNHAPAVGRSTAHDPPHPTPLPPIAPPPAY